jgi:hypothetical protein
MSDPVPASATPPSIFGREPALLLGIISGAIALVSSTVFTLTVEQQGVLNAVAAALLGLVVAIRVRGGTWAAALLALVKATIALVLAFKFALSPDTQSAIVFLTEMIVAYATRQVVAADPPAQPGTSPVA